MIVEGEAKTRGSLRAVELQRVALDALAEVPTALNPAQPIFTNRKGNTIDLHSFRTRAWTKALDVAGLAQRPPYAMRDTFATLSYAAGVSIEAIARQMGHVDQSGNPRPATTLKHYARFLPSVDQGNLARLDAFAARLGPVSDLAHQEQQ